MRRKTWPLVSLKHEVGPTVLPSQREIRVQRPRGVVDELKLRFGWTGAGARDSGSAIHLAAGCGCIHIALGRERLVRVTEIVGVSQGNRSRLGYAGGRSLVQPVAGLNVVLRGSRRCAA